MKNPPRIAGSLRGKSGKASGGQAGHAGDTLKPVAKPDVVERHEAQACRHCRAGLTRAMIMGVEKRQVFDVPEPRLEVTEQAMILSLRPLPRPDQGGVPRGVISRLSMACA